MFRIHVTCMEFDSQRLAVLHQGTPCGRGYRVRSTVNVGDTDVNQAQAHVAAVDEYTQYIVRYGRVVQFQCLQVREHPQCVLKVLQLVHTVPFTERTQQIQMFHRHGRVSTGEQNLAQMCPVQECIGEIQCLQTCLLSRILYRISVSSIHVCMYVCILL